MKRLLLLIIPLWLGVALHAQNVTIRAVDQPAAEVFRTIVEQTGKNFVYSSELLRDLRVSVDIKKKPLKQALDIMLKDTGIEYSIKGKNIILKKKPQPELKKETPKALPSLPDTLSGSPKLLEEVVVVSRLGAPDTETAEVGALKLTAGDVSKVPTLLGENDVLKALHMQPGVSGGAEGMAGMHVHGGNSDENLCMLDNVPLYQVNHFGGLFSAFNANAINYIDFFKSSIPAKYDGRLSSFLDAKTKSGSQEGHHGSFKLGLTASDFNIDGPIGRKTTYAVALRRSFYEVLTAPLSALFKDFSYEYAFMDFNGKLTHRFNNRATGFVSVYFGNDLFIFKANNSEMVTMTREKGRFNLHWGNLLAQTGFNYRFRPELTGEFTAAYTRYFSQMKSDVYTWEEHGEEHGEEDSGEPFDSKAITRTRNHINDWIARGDFYWQPEESQRVRFGASYTLHTFQPGNTRRVNTIGSTTVTSRDSSWSYLGNEVNLYIEDDWSLSDRWRINGGIHGSLFNLSGKTHGGIGPRLSARFTPTGNWAVKGAYSRTVQYVHQLSQTYLSLPTDQWVPITGSFKPQTADKIALGANWISPNGLYEASAEVYYKSMHNLVEYRDEYYLHPPTEAWNSRLCSGSGTAKGLDLKIEKTGGRLSGHIAYSLAWADRKFADKNGGKPFPARFDNRHTINILLNWNASKRVTLNAAWTGHSGNRFTFLPQVWTSPDIDPYGFQDLSPLKAGINNYQLPFYHRLDLSVTVRNRRGHWNFGLYNAYCHLNTVAIVRDFNESTGRPGYKKVKMLPIIPSISYTWQF